MSNADRRKVQKLVRDVVGEVLVPEARKIINTIDRLPTENIILSAKNADLRETIRLEKNKRRRGMPLFDDLGADGETKTMFFSPSKIQRAREHQAEKEQERHIAQAQKIEDKHQKELAKEAKQLLIAQRQAGREEARLQRLKEREQKRANQTVAIQQRIVDRQLKLELEGAKKQKEKPPQSSNAKEWVDIDTFEVPKEEVVQIRASRYRRQFKATKQFNL